MLDLQKLLVKTAEYVGMERLGEDPIILPDQLYEVLIVETRFSPLTIPNETEGRLPKILKYQFYNKQIPILRLSDYEKRHREETKTTDRNVRK